MLSNKVSVRAAKQQMRIEMILKGDEKKKTARTIESMNEKRERIASNKEYSVQEKYQFQMYRTDSLTIHTLGVCTAIVHGGPMCVYVDFETLTINGCFRHFSRQFEADTCMLHGTPSTHSEGVIEYERE